MQRLLLIRMSSNAAEPQDHQTAFAFDVLRHALPLEEVDFRFLRPLKPTVVFSTYWRFAVERQLIYFRRVKGAPAPWTDDPVLRVHKFTNAYRAADRVSQYLIRNVIGEEKRTAPETFFRVLLFKIFNKIETWELLMKELGNLSAHTFRFDRYEKVLTKAFESGERVYSAAYIMPSGGGKSGFERKHQMHLNMLKTMLRDELPEQIAESGSMARAFTLLRAYPTIGDFLAYQFITDLNYSDLTNFKESEFVVPGPGAKDGIRKCFSDFGGLTEAEIIKFVTDRQEDCLRAVGLRFPTLWGRKLQLIDCQNLFCEVDKYSRVMHPEYSGTSGRTRIKQKLRPKNERITPWFPPKWGINNKLTEDPPYVPNY